MTNHLSADDQMELTRISSDLHPPSEACLRFMAANDYDPQMPVFRAALTPQAMMKLKATRPEVANVLQLITGPFGIVHPEGYNPFRVAELQVGANVLDVEAEYE